ncbi:hypothetical protein QOM18_25610 [Serratia marcescens]|uniref:hypothetical protein n=1 Tax=Serratia marcescens TaxID=615 RepID=UPI0024C486EB|nr:hypothetical protein [Serratia marcescens]MDK1711701.1 hypothetical protein [Serratia marcescens]
MINKKRQYGRPVFLRGGGLMALLALAGSVQAADNSAADSPLTAVAFMSASYRF